MNQQNYNTMFLHIGIVFKEHFWKWDMGYFYRGLTWEQNWYILMSYSLRARLNILSLDSGLNKLRWVFLFLCGAQVYKQVILEVQMQRQHLLINISFNKLYVSTVDTDYKGMYQCFIIINNHNLVISLFNMDFIIYRMCNKADNYLWTAWKIELLY